MGRGSSRIPVYAIVNLALLAYVLAALFVEHVSGLSRGYFTDIFCQLVPMALPPVSLALLGWGLARLRRYKGWVAVPLLVLVSSFGFGSVVLLYLACGFVPGS